MSLTERATKDRGFSERYTLSDRLGVGGMGEVYRGIHRALGREVAIKFLVSDMMRDTQYRERFITEARIAAKLIHQNVVAVFDFGVANDMPYLVTELVEGRPLSDMIAGGARLPSEYVMSIALQLLDGLDAIHGIGIIHRDLKPENILMSAGQPPRVKIADFGIAKQEGSSGPETASGIVMGTPAYMAPEQALGDPLSPATDLYAFSLILYVLVIGHHPIKTGTAYETVRRQVLEVPRMPPEVPRPMAAVLNRGLAKSPAERYRTAAEMKADLMRIDSVTLDRVISKAIPAEKPHAMSTVASTQFEAIEGEAPGTLAMERGTMSGNQVLTPVAAPAVPPVTNVIPSKEIASIAPSKQLAATQQRHADLRPSTQRPAIVASTEFSAIRPQRGRGFIAGGAAVILITAALGLGYLHLSKARALLPPPLEGWTDMQPLVAAVVDAPTGAKAAPDKEIFDALELSLDTLSERTGGAPVTGARIDSVVDSIDPTIHGATPRDITHAALWDLAQCLSLYPERGDDDLERRHGIRRIARTYRTILSSLTENGRTAEAAFLRPGNPLERLGNILTLMADPETDELVVALHGLVEAVVAGRSSVDRPVTLAVIMAYFQNAGYTEGDLIPAPSIDDLPGPGTHPHMRELFRKINDAVGTDVAMRFMEGRHKVPDLERMLLVTAILHELETRAGGRPRATRPSMSLARLEKVPGFPAELRTRLLNDLGPGVALDLASSKRLEKSRLRELASAVSSPIVNYLVKKIPAT